MIVPAWLFGWVLYGMLAAPSETSILTDLEHLDQRLAQAERALRDNEAARARLQDELSTLQTVQASAKAHQVSAKRRFRTRLRTLARLPEGARWAILGGVRSLEEYLDTARLLRQVARHDRQLHAQYAAEGERLASLSTTVRQRRDAMDAVVAERRSQRDELAGLRQARADLLRSVRADRVRAEALAQEKRAAQEKLTRMVARLEAPTGPPTPAARPRRGNPAISEKAFRARLDPGRLRGPFAHNRGRLPWPAGGALRVAFGQRVELAFGTVTSHNGWDIGATAGTRVQAVAEGQVVYAGWLRGYGQMVIVDHGDGYHSVAAHLAAIDVQVGDAVSAGQWIGTVGDTGSLRGTVLYFEIRHRGVPIDPRDWLKR